MSASSGSTLRSSADSDLAAGITVVIGEPLYFDGDEVNPATRETYQRVSNRVMEAIAALKIDE
jgi:tyrosyl-tRNA synthetase